MPNGCPTLRDFSTAFMYYSVLCASDQWLRVRYIWKMEPNSHSQSLTCSISGIYRRGWCGHKCSYANVIHCLWWGQPRWYCLCCSSRRCGYHGETPWEVSRRSRCSRPLAFPDKIQSWACSVHTSCWFHIQKEVTYRNKPVRTGGCYNSWNVWPKGKIWYQKRVSDKWLLSITVCVFTNKRWTEKYLEKQHYMLPVLTATLVLWESSLNTNLTWTFWLV